MKVRRWLRAALGAPLTADERARSLTDMIDAHGAETTLEFLFLSNNHTTGRASALLAAQAMFVVVGTYAKEHSWSMTIIGPAMLLLMAGTLLTMTILKSTFGIYRPSSAELNKDTLQHVFSATTSRMIRFNIALYLTFLAVTLLMGATFFHADR